ncbi:MAG: VWA domain-containing protein [Saprospiraceae bacterium]
MINRQTTLSTNLIAFCRHLRQNDFTIGLSEEQDALLAIELVNPFASAESFELCLQAALCRTPYQLKRFPTLYQNYWRELDQAVDSKTTEKEEKAEATQQSQKQPSLQALKSWLYGNKNKETLETATYSDGGFGNATEQVAFSSQEMKEVFQLVQKLVQKIANRRSRRYQTTKKKAILDIKKSIRKNIVRNGEIVDILYKKKKKDNIKVVLLCDVSRSMELYSRFFIQFMYAFHSLFPKVETFAFATALHHISKELNKTSINQSLQEVINKIPDWSGGTKIGASLQQFNEEYGHKYLTSKTLVIVLSDGWDTDEVDLVGENMKQIHRKAMKVLWLNPLAGSGDWQPEVRGMKAALPYVDALLPFHNVESLKKIVQKVNI